MVATNFLLYTRKSRNAYTRPNGTFVKPLPAGSAFRVYAVERHNGQIWVKSGLGHWYLFDNELFEDAGCHTGARIAATPYKPSGSWDNNLPPYENGVIYAWWKKSSGYLDCAHRYAQV